MDHHGTKKHQKYACIKAAFKSQKMLGKIDTPGWPDVH